MNKFILDLKNNSFGWLIYIKSVAQIEFLFSTHFPFSKYLGFLGFFLCGFSSSSNTSCFPWCSHHNNCHNRNFPRVIIFFSSLPPFYCLSWRWFFWTSEGEKQQILFHFYPFFSLTEVWSWRQIRLEFTKTLF